MASAESQKATCPVCNRSDQVKTTEAAYNGGVASCAPPDMPTRTVPMFKYIMACMFLVGICVFFVIVLIGGLETNFDQTGMIVLVVLTLVSIVTALVVSYISFQRVVKGDEEATLLYPAWDQAMNKWRSLDYCARDQVIFDPKTNSVLSNEALASLRTVDGNAARTRTPSLVH
jgi:hypothetical protein